MTLEKKSPPQAKSIYVKDGFVMVRSDKGTIEVVYRMTARELYCLSNELDIYE